MIYLQNQLISNRHCPTEYNKLLYVYGGGGDGYCELLVNFVDFLFIVPGTCNFVIPGIRERERRPDSVKHLSLNHD